MRYIFGILLFNFFTYTMGFGTSILPNNSLKLRSNTIIQGTRMSVNRRDFFEIPLKVVKVSSIASLGFLSFTEKSKAVDYDDTWSKHNGPFSENDLGEYTKSSTGLLYKDVVEGTGDVPMDGDVVNINMVGYIFETGDKWCNTYKGIPSFQASVRAGVRENQKFMKGLNEGVKNMKRGGKRILVIPAYLAYNYTTIFSDKNPDVPIIPGGSNLVCYIEMVDFKPLKI
jgi:FKBP-type peptidyl-prolyl cis-trans isomerase